MLPRDTLEPTPVAVAIAVAADPPLAAAATTTAPAPSPGKANADAAIAPTAIAVPVVKGDESEKTLLSLSSWNVVVSLFSCFSPFDCMSSKGFSGSL